MLVDDVRDARVFSSLAKAVTDQIHSTAARLEPHALGRKAGNADRARETFRSGSASAAGQFHFEKDGSQLGEKYHALGTAEEMARDVPARLALLESPGVVAATLRFWDVCALGEHDEMSREQYLAVMMRVARALGVVAESDDLDTARALALDDWDSDMRAAKLPTDGSARMPLRVFCASLFELADVWVETAEEADYVAFLSTLFYRITRVVAAGLDAVREGLARLSNAGTEFVAGGHGGRARGGARGIKWSEGGWHGGRAPDDAERAAGSGSRSEDEGEGGVDPEIWGGRRCSEDEGEGGVDPEIWGGRASSGARRVPAGAGAAGAHGTLTAAQLQELVDSVRALAGAPRELIPLESVRPLKPADGATGGVSDGADAAARRAGAGADVHADADADARSGEDAVRRDTRALAALMRAGAAGHGSLEAARRLRCRLGHSLGALLEGDDGGDGLAGGSAHVCEALGSAHVGEALEVLLECLGFELIEGALQLDEGAGAPLCRPAGGALGRGAARSDVSAGASGAASAEGALGAERAGGADADRAGADELRAALDGAMAAAALSGARPSGAQAARGRTLRSRLRPVGQAAAAAARLRGDFSEGARERVATQGLQSTAAAAPTLFDAAAALNGVSTDGGAAVLGAQPLGGAGGDGAPALPSMPSLPKRSFSSPALRVLPPHPPPPAPSPPLGPSPPAAPPKPAATRLLPPGVLPLPPGAPTATSRVPAEQALKQLSGIHEDWEKKIFGTRGRAAASGRGAGGGAVREDAAEAGGGGDDSVRRRRGSEPVTGQAGTTAAARPGPIARGQLRRSSENTGAPPEASAGASQPRRGSAIAPTGPPVVVSMWTMGAAGGEQPPPPAPSLSALRSRSLPALRHGSGLLLPPGGSTGTSPALTPEQRSLGSSRNSSLPGSRGSSKPGSRNASRPSSPRGERRVEGPAKGVPAVRPRPTWHAVRDEQGSEMVAVFGGASVAEPAAPAPAAKANALLPAPTQPTQPVSAPEPPRARLRAVPLPKPVLLQRSFSTGVAAGVDASVGSGARGARERRESAGPSPPRAIRSNSATNLLTSAASPTVVAQLGSASRARSRPMLRPPRPAASALAPLPGKAVE